MTPTKRSLAALLIALTLFINVYKPQEHEQHAESPTESPAKQAEETAYVDDKLQAPPPPVRQPVIRPDNAEAKPVQPVSTVETVQSVQPSQPAPKPAAKPVTQTYEATFYTASCKGCSGTTAMGVDVRHTTQYKGYRVVAADKSVPFGTIMRITLADGTVINAIVADRGSAIKGKRLDVLVASYDEAIRLGRQQVTVEFVK